MLTDIRYSSISWHQISNASNIICIFQPWTSRWRRIKSYSLHRQTYIEVCSTRRDKTKIFCLVFADQPLRNINPQHLTIESNILNQTRKACALFFEVEISLWDIGMAGEAWMGFRDFDAYLRRINNVCSVIHSVRCQCSAEHWIALDNLNQL